MKYKKDTTLGRVQIVIDNFNAMLDECKEQDIRSIELEINGNIYSHPVSKKVIFKSLNL